MDKYEIFQIIMTLIYCLFFYTEQLMSQITALNGAEHPADMPEHLTKCICQCILESQLMAAGCF